MLRPDNVFLAVKPVDMRRGIDTLTQYIQDEPKSTRHEGAAFVFTNKTRSHIKVLRWDKHGVWLCVHRLHKGYFRWSCAVMGRVVVSESKIQMWLYQDVSRTRVDNE
ncbi:IS66 family insertion sequence element accessory protein TnpB [Salmonella enterica]|nr:IS66 family insertion sequence element accessory protein TnpB [Salmonella enterica]